MLLKLSEMQSINVQNPSLQRNKATPPNAGKVKLQFDYSPSQDGIDLNLLILLHGLGTLISKLFLYNWH